MKAWVVLYWDSTFTKQDWAFFRNEKDLIDFFMGDSYSTINNVYEVKDLKDVKTKYFKLLQQKKPFPGVFL
jgi:hypothetical protein